MSHYRNELSVRFNFSIAVSIMKYIIVYIKDADEEGRVYHGGRRLSLLGQQYQVYYFMHSIQHSTVLYYTELHRSIQYSIIQTCTAAKVHYRVQYYKELYRNTRYIIQYSTTLSCIAG
jgi:hypothetical protein